MEDRQSAQVKLERDEYLKYKAHCAARDVSIGEDLAELIRKHRLGGDDNGNRAE